MFNKKIPSEIFPVTFIQLLVDVIQNLYNSRNQHIFQSIDSSIGYFDFFFQSKIGSL